MNSREQGGGWNTQAALWSLTNLEPAFVWIPPEAEPEAGIQGPGGVWGCEKGKVDNRGYIFKSVTIEGN